MKRRLIQYDDDSVLAECRSSGTLSDPPSRYSSSSYSSGASSQSYEHLWRLAEDEIRRRQPAKPGNAAVLCGEVFVRANGYVSAPLDGLVDTGAAVSVIPQTLVQLWKLQPVGDVRLRPFSGPAQSYDRFWVDLLIPDLSARTVCVVSSDRPDVLIGRDVLDDSYFTYDGANKTYSIYEHGFVRRALARLLHFVRRFRDRAVRLTGKRI
jgi:hypothetical protein